MKNSGKVILLSCLLSLIMFPAFSQLNIRATLTDSISRQPVAYATISLYKSSNLQKPVSNIISGEDGSFNIRKPDTGSFRIIILHTAYQEKRFDAGLPVPSVILLSPKTKSITAVTVTARKPLIEKSEDKIIFNVEADPSLDGLMATDALGKTPFIVVDADGNVQLKGGSDFRVLLNGKESSLFAKNPSEALKSFPASSIKRIEVITNPSAKYDAEGAAGIINIITKRKPAGYNASVELYYNTYGVRSINTIWNVKAGKFGIAGTFSKGVGNTPAFTTRNVTEAIQPVTYSKRILEGTTTGPRPWQFINAEIGYDIDSFKTISIYSNNGFNKNNKYQQRVSSVINAAYTDTSQSNFIDTTVLYYPWSEAGLDYIHKFKDRPEKEWSAKMNYNYSSDHSVFNSEQFYSTYDRFSVNDSYSKNKQLTIQTDLILPFANSKKLETGLKVIIRNASALYETLHRYDQAKEFEIDSFNTNKFSYRQDVYSAYFLYSFKIKGWSLRIGSRVEHTEVKSEFNTSRTNIRQSYTHFIPALFLSTKLHEAHDISFSYTKRLRRPYVWDLNPFINNADSLNLSTGNPALVAEVTHSFEIGYGYYKKGINVIIKFSENLCNNQITSYSFFNTGTGVLLVKPDNIGRNLYSGINGSISVTPVAIWTISFNAGIQYNDISNKQNKDQRNTGFSGNSNLQNSFSFYKSLKCNINVSYSKPGIQLQGQSGEVFSYGFSVSNRFIKNKLQLSMGCAYPFQTKRYARSLFYDENFIQSTIIKYPAFRLGFSVRWNFGKLTENVGRKKNVENNVTTEN